MITTARQDTQDLSTQKLEIRVLTPGFYSRLVHYSSISEAIDRESVFTDERNRTLWICRPQLLPLLLCKKVSLQVQEKELQSVARGYLDETRWSLLRRLRCSPGDTAYSVSPQSSAFAVNDIRSQPNSELDNFVRSTKDNTYAAEYRRVVTKIFLAQRFGFGFSEVIGVVDVLLRVLLCYFGARNLSTWIKNDQKQHSWENLQHILTSGRGAPGFGALGRGVQAWWWMTESVIPVSVCHAYQVLKGYK